MQAIHKLLICIWAIIPGIGLIAQDFKADMRAMNEALKDVPVLYTEMKSDYFALGGKTPHYTTTAVIRKKGNMYSYTWDKNEFLLNERYIVMVNKDMKTIVVQDLKEEEGYPLKYVLPNIDSMLNDYSYPVEYKGFTADGKCYRVTATDHWINQAEVCLDEKNRWYNKITYWFEEPTYGQSGKVVTVFSKTDLNKIFSPTTFSIGQYLVKTPEGFKPTAKYKGYRVMDVTDAG